MSSGFKPTLPSTIDHLKQLLAMSPAHQVYKNSSKVDGARDLKQCQNIRYVSFCSICVAFNTFQSLNYIYLFYLNPGV